MLRSISFVVDGMVTTRVNVSGNLDGTLSFELSRPGNGDVGGLRAVYLDLNRRRDGDGCDGFGCGGFKVFGDAGLSLGAVAEAGVDTLGRAATVAHPARDPLGDFDVGISFEPLGDGRRPARALAFTLAHDTVALTLDMVDLADFGLRYELSGAGQAQVAETGAESERRGAAAWDAIAVVETQTVAARPLAVDEDGGAAAVIDFGAAREALFAASSDGSRGDTGWGRLFAGPSSDAPRADRRAWGA